MAMARETEIFQSRPSRPSNGKGKRLNVISDFALELERHLALSPPTLRSIDDLIKEARKHTSTLHSYYQKSDSLLSASKELDERGTRLWNHCGRLRRELTEDQGGLKELFLVGRVFAFHLLAVARQAEKYKIQDAIRLMRLSLQVCRDCTKDSDIDLASMVLEKAADYSSSLKNHLSIPDLPEAEVGDLKSLIMDFFTIRTALAWKQGRLDIADHMYKESKSLQNDSVTADSSEKQADVLYEIGKSLSAEKNFVMAVKWLERASETIHTRSLENLSRDGIELRLTILQALVTALLNLNTADGYNRAHSLVGYIEAEVGTKPLVLLLRLDLFQNSPAQVFDCDAYADMLRLMIKTFTLTDAAVKLLIHHIRKLHDKSPGLACSVLSDFIGVVQECQGKQEWLERLVGTRMWMALNERDSKETIEAADRILCNLRQPLSVDATVAIQALFWKRLEANYSQGCFELAQSWCRLCLHDAFRKSGPLNTAKIERKHLLCALSQNSLESAMSVVDSMSVVTRGEPATVYLIFKLALRSNNQELGYQCLESLSSSDNYNEYLSACIAEAQHAGNNLVAIDSLKKLVAKYEYHAPSPIHLPALLRSTIRLLYSQLDKPGYVDGGESQTVQDLCSIFEAVSEAIQREPQGEDGNKLFSAEELEWFSRSAYNLGLKHVQDWDLRYTVRILTACIKVSRKMPTDLSASALGDLSLKLMFSHFIIASALVSLARAQDNLEIQLQDYLSLRKHVSEFDALVLSKLEGIDEPSQKDLLQKLATLLSFDFEAAACLKEWDELGNIVLKAVPCKNAKAFQFMADYLLRSNAAGQVLYSTLRKILNEIWELEDFGTAKLAKYTRLLFQATLPLQDDLAIQVIDTAYLQAREASDSEHPWPVEEIEWLATTAYNHSVDCYGALQDDRAKEWVTKAISLAHYCGDGRALENAIHSKSMTMNLGVPK